MFLLSMVNGLTLLIMSSFHKLITNSRKILCISLHFSSPEVLNELRSHSAAEKRAIIKQTKINTNIVLTNILKYTTKLRAVIAQSV
jgi:hypothetical protein